MTFSNLILRVVHEKDHAAFSKLLTACLDPSVVVYVSNWHYVEDMIALAVHITGATPDVRNADAANEPHIIGTVRADWRVAAMSETRTWLTYIEIAILEINKIKNKSI